MTVIVSPRKNSPDVDADERVLTARNLAAIGLMGALSLTIVFAVTLLTWAAGWGLGLISL